MVYGDQAGRTRSRTASLRRWRQLRVWPQWRRSIILSLYSRCTFFFALSCNTFVLLNRVMSVYVPLLVDRGDNMYYYGIDESSDANDMRFQRTFEDVYTQPELQIPWYVIAGNHDWRGNVQAQIDYTALSERWNFPDYKHAHKFSWQEGEQTLEVEVLMIDTTQLSGMGPDVSPDHPLYFSQPTGPLNATLASETYSWLEEKMAASTADYLWVAGHYPVYSACPHGGTQSLLDNLKPMLDQYEGHYM
jgi:tartrate-resistant acid phosphatase type 5